MDIILIFSFFITLMFAFIGVEATLHKFSLKFSYNKKVISQSFTVSCINYYKKEPSFFLLCGTEGENDKMREKLMSIDELKAELELRGVDFKDCFSKSELVNRLIESRVVGKANPDILDKFNSVKDEVIDMSAIDSNVFDDISAQDGGLPGGLPKEMIKALAGDKEIMNMLKDPKMQDIMKAVMTGGPTAMKKYLSDPDAIVLLQRLSKAMAKATEK